MLGFGLVNTATYTVKYCSNLGNELILPLKPSRKYEISFHKRNMPYPYFTPGICYHLPLEVFDYLFSCFVHEVFIMARPEQFV